jgi:hypothetical protein
MSPLVILDPRQPLSIDSFEFLYQAIAKDISSYYIPVRDGLALLAGFYVLKKLLPVPYYIYRTIKLYFFPYKINAVLLKTPVTTNSNDLSLPDHDEHWALINDCTTPSGCAFAQNLAVNIIFQIVPITIRMKVFSLNDVYSFCIRHI